MVVGCLLFVISYSGLMTQADISPVNLGTLKIPYYMLMTQNDPDYLPSEFLEAWRQMYRWDRYY
ncbi:MAG TPA: hypothetical protein DCY91_18020 [Cyanobacteria bacterium UBA11370]|nr:hypothetical protein [Cyanobacteria bacterium UBA11370]HBY80562.1 hypothetical protein [Cyanobacteria bacterium UBA11148]